MRALTSLTAPPYLRLDDVEEPLPAKDEAVVRVHASSLNRGEVLDLAGRPEGSPSGWDVAGVVDTPAADGRGWPAGARVFGLLRSGAWAERVAVRSTMLAAIPDGVSDADAAALPSAGLTALKALELGGLLLGKRVLVTGANGGVGRFAVALAHLSGAETFGLVRDLTTSGEVVAAAGATPITSLDQDFDVVIDGVGGQVFGGAIEHLSSRGILVNIATDDSQDTVTFRAARFDRSPGARIVTFNLTDELAISGGATRDLERLGRLVADGRLRANVECEASWRDPAPAVEALLHKGFGGKVVLRID